jgi:hypothetical protein
VLAAFKQQSCPARQGHNKAFHNRSSDSAESCTQGGPTQPNHAPRVLRLGRVMRPGCSDSAESCAQGAPAQPSHAPKWSNSAELCIQGGPTQPSHAPRVVQLSRVMHPGWSDLAESCTQGAPTQPSHAPRFANSAESCTQRAPTQPSHAPRFSNSAESCTRVFQLSVVQNHVRHLSPRSTRPATYLLRYGSLTSQKFYVTYATDVYVTDVLRH